MTKPSNSENPEINKKVEQIGKALYGCKPELIKCNSAVNYCCILRFPNGIADRVIKFANRQPYQITEEIDIYPILSGLGWPVPEIEHTHVDCEIGAQPFIIMPKFSDYTLGALCQKNPIAGSIACENAGRFISAFSKTKLKLIKKFIKEKIKYEIDLIKEYDSNLFQEIKEYFALFPGDIRNNLIHGQLHTNNVLADADGKICIVDFGESIKLSSPIADLALLLWTHRNWSSDDLVQRNAILKGYGGIMEDDIAEIVYWDFRFHVTMLKFAIERNQIQKCKDLAEGLRDLMIEKGDYNKSLHRMQIPLSLHLHR